MFNPFKFINEKITGFKERQRRLYELRILEKEDIILYDELEGVVLGMFSVKKYHPSLAEYDYRIDVIERVIKFREDKGWDVTPDIELLDVLKALRRIYLKRVEEEYKNES